jgi:hypothetical protein
MSGIALRHAASEQDVAACFPVIVQLRLHLVDTAEFVARVARQRARAIACWRLGAMMLRSRWLGTGRKKT